MIARVMRVKDLTEIIREEIVNSDLSPGAPILSARGFAEKYGTSVLTAHRAINNLVEAGMLYRVKGSGSFIAGTETSEKTLNIGICFPTYHGNPAAVFAAFEVYQDTISKKLRQAGHSVINFTYNELKDKHYIQTELRQLDGLIMSESCIDDKTFSLLEKSGIPVVTMQHESPRPHPFHQVMPDLLPGFREALSHLKGNGHNRFTIAANFKQGHQKYRIEAIYLAAEQLGIPKECFKEIFAEIKFGDSGRMSGQELGNIIFNKNGPYPAILTVSDFTAFGIMDIILQKKLKPGIDVSLISYDDLEGDGFLPFERPMISSIRNFKKEIALEAVSLLLKSVEEQKKVTSILRLPTSFIKRESSAIQEV